MAKKARDYKAEYQRRIERGLKEGLSRSQARGHPRAKKGEKSASQVKKEKKIPPGVPVQPPKEPRWIGYKDIETPYTRKKDKSHPGGEKIVIPMLYDDYQKYQKLLKDGKPKAAKVFALDEVYGVPELSGIGWDEDFPYDDYADWFDIPEYDDDYAANDS